MTDDRGHASRIAEQLAMGMGDDEEDGHELNDDRGGTSYDESDCKECCRTAGPSDGDSNE